MMPQRPLGLGGSGAGPGPTVTVAELAALMDGPHAPVLLDVRWSLTGPPGLEDYRRGHLRGARFVDLDADLAAPPSPGRGRHPLPERGAFERAMRRAGVRDGSSVVAYDAGGGLSAARAWWLLRHHGHGDVRVLDGGLAAWTASRRPVNAAPVPEGGGDFSAGPGAMPVLDADSAASLAREGILLDARAAERYRGEVEPIDAVAGHIPGARSAPTTANLDPSGAFRPPAELRARFAALGAGRKVSVGAYCGSGITAAHEVLALALAGIPAALYPGSWSEWVSDPSRPVALGPEPG
ncbi:MAG: sulfurtransferase [Candidatus Dormibacteraeota bacterium]|nr:sulfurtransferase [Candidatus Dormibacteraeota bacterium]